VGLRSKFNIGLIVVFVIGWLISGYIVRDTLYKNAAQEVVRQATLMIDSASSMRKYTSDHITPNLPAVIDGKFMPQTIPTFSVLAVFETLKKKYPGYMYRDAVLNPTNPRDRAFDWEASLINQFRADNNLKELSGTTDIDGANSVLYIARPIQIKDSKCLACHTTPEIAPAALVKEYGLVGGFGWQLDEIIGAQVVTVPTAIPYEHADRAFKSFMVIMLVTFFVIFLILNLMLSLLVVSPVKTMSQQVDLISQGKMNLPELSERGSDEISVLRKSINRLRRSLQIAIDMIAKGQK